MYSEKTLLDMVTLVYDAAADFPRWTTFLERYQAILEARNVAFGYTAPGREGMLIATGADQADIRKYHQYPCPWLERLVRSNWRSGGADASHHLITDRELENTECFSRFLGPRQFHYGLGAAIVAVGDAPATFVVLREKPKGPYSDGDLEFLRALIPHMSRALQLYGRIASLDAERRALTDALDRLATGVILLDSAGRVLFANRAARQIADQNDGLRIERDGLASTGPRETAELRALILQAAQTTKRNGFHAGGELLLARPSLRSPLALTVSPLPQEELFPGLPGAAAVAVFVSEPGAAGESDGQLLGRLYGLTAAESRLAAALMSGNDLREVSDTLGISYHTARAQAKSVFSKTGARRQAELVHLLLKLPSRADAAPGVPRNGH
jgi:DNA-binding CsgD family transcriptional regulator